MKFLILIDFLGNCVIIFSLLFIVLMKWCRLLMYILVCFFILVIVVCFIFRVLLSVC